MFTSYSIGVLQMKSTASTLQSFFLHVLCNVRKLSFHSLMLIRFQEGKRGFKHSVCCFILVGLAVHVAFDIAFLTIGEIAVARLNKIDNSLNCTS